jgi:hypothetical protein
MKAVLSEPELISAIAVRDPAGAVALYDQYAGTLFKIICCSVPNRQTAEAILEKTLNSVWHNCKDHQLQDKPLLLWMAGIARQFAQQEKED